MAQITLTVDDAHVPRILAAIATEQNPTPNAGDVKARLIDYLRAVVQRHEREQAATADLGMS